MSRPKAQNLIHAAWGFIGSVRLTIALLVILAFVSVLGTLIPQQESSIEFSRKISPRLFYLLNSFNMFDLYHSLWFRIIIASLAVNLTVCSIIRFPGTWKLFKTTPKPDREKPFESLPPEQSFVVNKSLEDTTAETELFLKTRYKKINVKKADNKSFFYFEKGRYSGFGVYLVHLSVLIIIAGALVGSFFGFKAYVNIEEGESVDSVYLVKGKKPLVLGFEIRCDKFNIIFYENGAPKEYKSELTFMIDGEEIDKRQLLVNHPVHFRGITFYQASYGAASVKKVFLKIKAHENEDEEKVIEAEQDVPLAMPDNKGHFAITDFKDNFMNMMGPAVQISIMSENGQEVVFWIFQHYDLIRERFPKLIESSPRLNPSSFKPYVFSFEGFDYNYFTGLQVNKDPGVPIVWTGFFLMICGFIVTFYSSHMRIWIRLSCTETGVEISAAGTSNKNPVGLKRKIENLADDLKETLT